MTDEDDDLIDVIPASFASVAPKKNPGDAPVFRLDMLRGKRVVLRSAGLEYRGVLVGADEGEVFLRGELRWVILPLDQVTDLRLDLPDTTPLGGYTPRSS